jgi:hypothetical protein
VRQRNAVRWHNTEFSVMHWVGSLEEVVAETNLPSMGGASLSIHVKWKDLMRLTRDGRLWHTWQRSNRLEYIELLNAKAA